MHQILCNYLLTYHNHRKHILRHNNLYFDQELNGQVSNAGHSMTKSKRRYCKFRIFRVYASWSLKLQKVFEAFMNMVMEILHIVYSVLCIPNSFPRLVYRSTFVRFLYIRHFAELLQKRKPSHSLSMSSPILSFCHNLRFLVYRKNLHSSE